ncbi:MAG: aldehyde dehydrogenase family protein [Streptosporangiaceae bacterium]
MSFTSVNPHDPADVLGEWEAAGPAGADAAVARARAAAPAWRDTPGAARAKALSDAAAALQSRSVELTDLVIREVGKPATEARGEVARGVAILRYFAQEALAPDGETLPAAAADQLLFARQLPVGVAALVTPWNFPVAIPLWKAAPSLAYGNATVLKPSSAAAATALALRDILGAVLPPGVFGVVLGGAETAQALLGHPDVAAVSFTGSSAAGRDVAARAAARGCRVQAEMGGQNPSVVLADADLERAAAAIAYAAMGYAGQKCTATSRVIVAEPVYEPFRQALTAAIEALGVIDPADERTLVGPVIDAGSRAAALAAVQRSGGRVLTGGRALEAPGYYLAPTLVELDSPAGPLATDEVFAPVAAMIRARSADAAIEIANAVRYGLVASVFTSDLGQALRLTRRLDAGMVRVNAPTSGVDFNAPFGGAKESSYGPREQGKAARAFYTESQTVLMVP